MWIQNFCCRTISSEFDSIYSTPRGSMQKHSTNTFFICLLWLFNLMLLSFVTSFYLRMCFSAMALCVCFPSHISVITLRMVCCVFILTETRLMAAREDEDSSNKRLLQRIHPAKHISFMINSSSTHSWPLTYTVVRACGRTKETLERIYS